MSLYFTKTHEWVKITDETAIIGITDYAQSQLGDVVFAEMPAIGRAVKRADAVAIVESIKAASDIYAPISGEVTDNNQALVTNPALVNQAPQEAGSEGGWFFKLTITDAGELDGLMDEAAYQAYLKTLA